MQEKFIVMQLSDILTLAGTVGGMQGIIEAARWWQSRRISIRRDEAAVAALESENTRKQTDWLEQRLSDRDTKIDSIYAELRKEQALRIDEMCLRHQAELRLTEAEARKCLIHDCPQREPQSNY